MKSQPFPSPIPSRPRTSRWISCIAAAAVIGSILFGTESAFAAPSTTIVISQVYGGGGNAGAPYTNDFVELHNISNSTVSLTGWRVQYAGATGSSWQGPNLSGSIPAGAYYLIQMAGGTNGVALPTPDLTSNTAMSATAGKVALTNTTTTLTVADPSSGSTVVDFVGFGTTANGFEGTGPTPAPSATTSVSRKDFGSQDTDDNASDFLAGAPAPRNSSTTPYIPASDTTPPTIATLTPMDNATDVLTTTTQLVATFDENVVKGTGDITLKLADNSTVMTIAVTDAAVAVSGATATITLPGSLAGSTAYYVNIAAGAFKDLSNNNFAGIADATTWNFTTAAVDVTPPALVALSPADDSSTVLPTTNLAITYDEAILAGSGSVVIRKSSDASLVETISVPGAKVSVSGNTATINPAAVLDYATGYYVEVSAGAFTDLSANAAPAISGATAWNFTTRDAPVLVISQYYEGLSFNKYIELKNLTNDVISLDGYNLAVWANDDRQNWKSGVSSTLRVASLAGRSIPANGSFLVKDVQAAAPTYAVTYFDLSATGQESVVGFNGDDSVVLYNGAGFSLDELVDAVSFAASDGADKSFYRLNNGPGFDLTAGSSILNFPAVWGTKTLAEVADASLLDDWYLRSSGTPLEPGVLTLTLDEETVFENTVTPVLATLTRSEPYDGELIVYISSSRPDVVLPPDFVIIEEGEASVDFELLPEDTTYQVGDRVVTLTATADFFSSDTAQLTVQDNPEDIVLPVVINEVDSDTPGTDVDEFIELYNNASEELSLDGLVLVLFNGSGDVSYRTIDLSGKTIPGNGFFVVGNSAVSSAQITFPNGTLQNGPDAVALIFAEASAIPNGTPVASTPGILVDAVVYGTDDPDATGLLAALTPGQPQVDEGTGTESGTAPLNSIARASDGGPRFASNLYVAQTPTPGVTNVLPAGGNTFAAWINGFDFSAYPGADLSPTGDADNDGVPNALENILGTNPAAFSQALLELSASGGNLSFQHTLNPDPAADLSLVYEWSTDLVIWYGNGEPNPGGTTVTFIAVNPLDPPDQDLFFVSATVSGPATSKVFTRLRVDQVLP